MTSVYQFPPTVLTGSPHFQSCAASLASEHRPRRQMSAEHQQSAKEYAPEHSLAEAAAQGSAGGHAEQRRRERGG
jgi:hypothetical protein